MKTLLEAFSSVVRANIQIGLLPPAVDGTVVYLCLSVDFRVDQIYEFIG